MATNERLAALRARLGEAVRFHPRETVSIVVLAILLVAGAGLSYARSRPVPSADLAPVAAPEAPSAVAPVGAVFVHVVGAVRRPGVYELPEGARVFDAVEAAGGLRAKADPSALNLARPVSDGEQVVVPKRGSAPAGGGGTQASGPSSGGTVNINLASASELETLPGIGPVLAERIVAYREQHGPFRTVRDLLKVSGIGPKKFEALEGSVTV